MLTRGEIFLLIFLFLGRDVSSNERNWALNAISSGKRNEAQSWMTSDPFKPTPSSRGAVLKPLRDGEVTPCNGTM